MNFRTLLALILGMALVVGIAGLGLLQAFDRAHTLRADEATIESDQVVVGTAFSGSVSDISVAPGDRVAPGDELFRLQSPTLQQARETLPHFALKPIARELHDPRVGRPGIGQ